MTKAAIKGSAEDQPSYRIIHSVEAETLIKQAADYFRLGDADRVDFPVPLVTVNVKYSIRFSSALAPEH
jgi:hypothetical protein